MTTNPPRAITQQEIEAIRALLSENAGILSAAAGAEAEGAPVHCITQLSNPISSLLFWFPAYGGAKSATIDDGQKIEKLRAAQSRLAVFLSQARDSVDAFQNFDSAQRALADETLAAVDTFRARMAEWVQALCGGHLNQHIHLDWGLKDYNILMTELNKDHAKNPIVVTFSDTMKGVFQHIKAAIQRYGDGSDPKTVKEVFITLKQQADVIRDAITMDANTNKPHLVQLVDDQDQYYIEKPLETLQKLEQRLRHIDILSNDTLMKQLNEVSTEKLYKDYWFIRENIPDHNGMFQDMVVEFCLHEKQEAIDQFKNGGVSALELIQVFQKTLEKITPRIQDAEKEIAAITTDSRIQSRTDDTPREVTAELPSQLQAAMVEMNAYQNRLRDAIKALQQTIESPIPSIQFSATTRNANEMELG